MDEQQRQAFEQAVERKKDEARAASEATRHDNPSDTGITQEVQDSIIKQGSQDANSPRDKNSQHGKVTADKWNQ